MLIKFCENAKGKVFLMTVFDPQQLQKAKDESFSSLVLISLLNVQSIDYANYLGLMSDDEIVNVLDN
jgi:hypothetical protein